jgi:acetyl-CoA carboxylase carboxyl transferase subunit beta
MGAGARLKSVFDEGKFEPIAMPDVPLDPLKFRDERRYVDRLKDAKNKTGTADAVVAGVGTLDGQDIVAAVQDFEFMGGSLGMAAGEAVITAMLKAVEQSAPFVLFVASGGARMQEGMLSLMQMPRTTVAVQKLREARLPYIVVLTHPTTGGVTASYAMLGDVHIAEPGALIGFAGPRVIEQTIREKLPEGFQRSQYLVDHGMVDMVVHRHDMRKTLSQLCSLLMQGRHIKRRAGHVSSAARYEAEPRPREEKPLQPAKEMTPRPSVARPANDAGAESTAIALPPPERKAAE